MVSGGFAPTRGLTRSATARTGEKTAKARDKLLLKTSSHRQNRSGVQRRQRLGGLLNYYHREAVEWFGAVFATYGDTSPVTYHGGLQTLLTFHAEACTDVAPKRAE